MSQTQATTIPLALLLTNTEDVHAGPVERELDRLGTRYVRLDTDVAWPESAVSFELDARGEVHSLFSSGSGVASSDEVTSVWNRRPTRAAVHPDLAGNPREFAIDETTAALRGAVRSLDCAWLSHPDAVRAASFRPAQLRVAAQTGFTVPETLVSQNPDQVREFIRSIGGTAVAKLVSSGPPRLSSNDPYNIFAGLVNEQDLDPAQVALAPVLYQRPIAKAYELRVTLVGKELLACSIDSQSSEHGRVDWRRADPETMDHRSVELDERTASQ